MVEAVRPPMLTSASPWVVEPLSPKASAMGTMATTVVRVVMRIGLRRVAPASTRAVFRSISLLYWFTVST